MAKSSILIIDIKVLNAFVLILHLDSEMRPKYHKSFISTDPCRFFQHPEMLIQVLAYLLLSFL